MNGFIPALLAVLFAEIGERATLFERAPRRDTLGYLIVAMIAAAGAAGSVLAPHLTTNAATLMLGVVLTYAGLMQLRAVKALHGFWRHVFAFANGSALLVVFAMAVRFGAIAAFVGGIAGLAGAVLMTHLATQAQWKVSPIRWGSAILLIVVGLFVAVSALQIA